MADYTTTSGGDYYLDANEISCEYLYREQAFRLTLSPKPERLEDGTYKHHTFQFLIPQHVVRSMAEAIDRPPETPSQVH